MAQSHLQITLNWAIKQFKKPKVQRIEDIFADKPADISLQDFKSDLRFITNSISKVYKKPITTPMLFAMDKAEVEKALNEWGWKADGLSLLYNGFIFNQKIGRFICKDDKTKILEFDKKSKSFYIVKYLYDNIDQVVTTEKIAEYVKNKTGLDYNAGSVRSVVNNSIIPRFQKAQANIGFPFEIVHPDNPTRIAGNLYEVGHKGIMMRKLIK